ncbi:hypothetical protein GCM10016455_15810 [Aliiroseovarius zhejiangensis]|uniref:Uncharacterized protein n=1 Tax=Aliiroseovarius zhejiangensis TaxID=1632025 RepID=A0ABQ3J1W1_9RHOB|nr:hypothetical protein [Aliiroseovarius zhejiangensis]GHE96301.1 hypothetical protein GCM10016455_15810 [Aliiroseovarius zhejiangensis]
MTVVVKLSHRETVRLDRAQLERMYVQWGPVRADKEVNQALEDLAIGMAEVQKSHRQRRSDDLREQVRNLIAIANKIGMTSLGRVARDVLDLSDGTDEPAFHATVARLGRIGERSLIAVWDIQDMSI